MAVPFENQPLIRQALPGLWNETGDQTSTELSLRLDQGDGTARRRIDLRNQIDGWISRPDMVLGTSAVTDRFYLLYPDQTAALEVARAVVDGTIVAVFEDEFVALVEADGSYDVSKVH